MRPGDSCEIALSITDSIPGKTTVEFFGAVPGSQEALDRMIEQARGLGHDDVFNVRLETSRLANSSGEGNRTAGLEMPAFGTAVKSRSKFEPRTERF